MPAKNNKKTYSISDVASTLQVSQHVIRRWEKEIELEVARNERGHRTYSTQNIETLVKHQQRKISPINVEEDTFKIRAQREEDNKSAKKFTEAYNSLTKVGTHFKTAGAITLVVLFLLTAGIARAFTSETFGFSKILSSIQLGTRNPLTFDISEDIDADVLGQRDQPADFLYRINVPTNIGGDFTVEGDSFFQGDINLQGTGTLIGLTAIDATTQTTIQNSLTLGGDLEGTLGEAIISAGVLDGTEFADEVTLEGDLDVKGEVQADGDAGSDGQVLTSTGNGVEWLDIDTDEADTLDGIDSLQFLRSDVSDTYTVGTLSFADSTFLDLSAIVHDDTTPQGLLLPQADFLEKPSTGAGYLAYEADEQRILVYNGSNWANISGASSSMQEAYEQGSAITMSAAEGDLRISNDALTEIFFADEDTGRVGIGTITPSYKLSVVGDIQISSGSELYSFGSATLGNRTYTEDNYVIDGQTFTASIDNLDQQLADVVGGTTGLWRDAGSYIYANNYNDFAITDGGNVGVGTNSPSFKLDVVGTLGVSGAVDFDGLTSSTSENTIVVQDNNGVLMAREFSDFVEDDLIAVGEGVQYFLPRWTASRTLTDSNIYDNGTYVGIGTSSPSYTMHLYNETDNLDLTIETDKAEGQAGIRLINDATAWRVFVQNDDTFGISNTTSGTNPFQINSMAPSSSLVVQSDGDVILNSGNNLGIGTTGPSDELHVVGNIFATSGFHVGADGTGTLIDDASNGASSSTLYIGNESILASGDLGVTVQGYNANTSFLAQTIEGSEITDDTIEEIDLEVTNSGTDDYLLSYDNATGGFTWVDPTTAGTFDGSGTANYITKFTDFDTLAISGIYETGGNVGIGTTAPGSTLDINGSFNVTGTNGNFTVESTGNNVALSRAGSNNIYASDAAGILNFGAAGTKTDLIIVSLGRIKIPGYLRIGANTVPTNTLDIDGEIAIGVNYAGVSAPTNGAIIEGTVGIGTTAPSARLHAVISGSGDAFKLSRSDSVGYLTYDMTSNYSNFDSYGDYRFNAQGVEKMVLEQNSGNLGIGTTAPSYKLDVNGDINIASGSDLYSEGTATLGTRLYTEDNYVVDSTTFTAAIDALDQQLFDVVSGASGIWTDQGTYIEPSTSAGNFVISDAGLVGIGTTSPSTLLSLGSSVDAQKVLLYDANSTVKYGFGIQSGELRQFVPSGGSVITFGNINSADGTTYTEKIRIDATSGNVGIGNTNPSSLLQLTSSSNLISNIMDVEGQVSTENGAGIYVHPSFQVSVKRTNLYGMRVVPEISNYVSGVESDNYYTIFGGAPTATGTVTNAYGLYIEEPTLGTNNYGAYIEGNVGIGTTSPTDTLHVVGNILATTGVHIGTDADGTLIDDASNGASSTTLYIGNESILASGDLGVTVQGYNADTSFLAQTIEGSEITDDTIEEIDFEATNSATDNYMLTYDNATGGFTWVDPTGSGVGSIDGSGTANYVTKWSDSNTLADSILYDTGSALGIGTTAPSSTLSVVGDFTTDNINLNGNTIAATTAAGLFLQDDGGNGIFVEDGGFVGIGTSSPTQALDINGKINIQGSNLYGAPTFYIGVSDSERKLYWGSNTFVESDNDVYITSGSSAGDKVVIGSSSEAMRILSTGNVGIGSTNPTSLLSVGGGNQFQVDSSGDITKINNVTYAFPSSQAAASNYVLSNDGIGNLSWTSVTGGGLGAVDGTGTANYLPLWSDSDTLTSSSLYETGGNIGIGTTAPDAILHIQASTTDFEGLKILNSNASAGTITSSYLQLGITNSVSEAFVKIAATEDNVNSWPSLALSVYDSGSGNPVERMRIAPGGNVGIGTTSPTSLLSVGAASEFQVDSSGDIVKLNNVTYAWPSSQAVADNYVLTNDSSGNLAWEALGAGGLGGMDGSGTAGYTALWSDEDTLTSSSIYETGGNIGIGTTAPNISSLDKALTIASFTNNEVVGLEIGGRRSSGNGLAGVIDFDNTIYNEVGARIGYILGNAQGGDLHGGTLTFSTRFAGVNPLTERMRISNTGSVGIGTTAPAAKLDSLDTTEQLRLSYNASNYGSFTVDINGDLTIAPSGGDLNITGNQDISGHLSLGTDGAYNVDYIVDIDETSTLDASVRGISMELDRNFTQTAARTDYGTYTNLNINDVVENGFNYVAYGTRSSVNITEGSTANALYGAYDVGQANHTTGTVDEITGTYGVALNNADGTATTLYGSRGFARNDGYSINIYGGSFTAANATTVADAANYYGVYSLVDNDANTATSANTFYGLIDNATSVTIGTSYGLRLNTTNLGTITTSYGIYIQDIIEGTQTNAYGIWANEGDWVLDEDGNGVIGGTGPGGDFALGEAQDLELYHDGTNSYIMNNTGDLYIGDAGTDDVILSNNGGKVGIGTDTPQDLLQISGASPTTRILSTNSGNFSQLKLSYSTSDTHGLHFSYKGNGAKSYIEATYPSNDALGYGDIHFRSNQSGIQVDTLIIRGESGNVGIGTTAPSYKLDVNGNINIASGSDFYSEGTATLGDRLYTEDNYVVDSTTFTAAIDALDQQVYDLSSGAAGLWNDNTTYISPTTSTSFVIEDAGNVGIGTTNPEVKLNVNGAIRSGIANSTAGDLSIYEGSGGNDYWRTYGATGNNSFLTDLEGTSAIGDWEIRDFNLLVSTGNVGIGTTSPSAKLELAGGGLQINTDHYGIGFNSETPGVGDVTGDAARIYFDANYISTNDYMVFEKTDINDANPDGGFAFVNKGQDNVGEIALVIKGTGLVGIGTTSPTDTLHVVGNVLATTGVHIGTDADGTLIDDSTTGSDSTTLYIGNESILASGDIGVTVQGYDANTSLLAQTIEGSEITNDTIEEIDLEVTNAPTDDYVLSYDSATGGFTWIASGGGTLDGTGTANYLPLWSDATTLTSSSLYETGGQIGIGTTAPGAPLGFANVKETKIKLYEGANYDIGVDTGEMRFIVPSSDKFTFGKGSFASFDEWLRIDNGSMGIGTTSPAFLLDVAGTFGVSGAVDLDGLPSDSSEDSIVVQLADGTLSYREFQDFTVDDGIIDGVGTANYIPIWNDANTIGLSSIYETGGLVGIGTTSPSGRLHILGSADDQQLIIQANGTQTANLLELQDSSANVLSGADFRGILFSDGGTDIKNFLAGNDVGNITMTGINNNAIGYQALYSNASGASNTAIGNGALYSNQDGSFNNAYGDGALYSNTSGNHNQAIGNAALNLNSTGSYNNATGYLALFLHASGDYNIASGREALSNIQTGVGNIGLGYRTGGYGTGGAFTGADYNTIIGYEAGYNLGASDDYNVYIGYQAGYSETGSNKLYLANGDNTALIYGDFSTGTVGIGGTAAHTNPFVYVGTDGKVGIGTTAPSSNLHINRNDTSTSLGQVIVAQEGTGDSSVQYSLTGVTNWITGIDNSDSNSFKLSEGNTLGTSDRFVVETGGQIGIGTATPTYQLDIVSSDTTGGLQLTADSVTTGTGALFSFDGLTTGTGLNLSSTSADLTSGSLFNMDWSPSSATSASGDLFLVNVGTNATMTGNILAIQDNGSDLFTIDQATITSALPHSFTAAGDVSMAYDLIMTNQTASKIESYGPFTIEVGESFESSDLTLKTYNNGNVYVNLGSGSTAASAQLLVDGNISDFIGGFTNDGNADTRKGLFIQGCLDTNPTSACNLVEYRDGNGTIIGAVEGNGAGGVTAASGGSDYAELFNKEATTLLEAGDLIALNSEGKIEKAKADGTTMLIGAYSNNPNTLGNWFDGWETSQEVAPVGLLGQLNIKVSNEKGEIKAGDAITVSKDNPGVGVKAKSAGRIIGFAMEDAVITENSVEGDLTQVRTYISPTWYVPSLALNNAEVAGESTSSETINAFEDTTTMYEAMLAIFNEFKTFTEALGIIKQTDAEGNEILAIASDLNVTGTTTLADVKITGNLTAGLIEIDSINNEVNVLGASCYNSSTNTHNEELCEAQELSIQAGLSGNVNFFKGAIVLSPEGTVTATKVVTEELATEILTITGTDSKGIATIKAGENKLTIENSLIEDSSLIFVTPNSDTEGAQLFVAEKVAGEKFVIGMTKTLDKDIEFNWLIVKSN